MKFIDQVNIVIASGHGGPGSVSFRREAFAPRGGPDGGNGGKGGDLILKVEPHLNSLVDFKRNKKYAAANGQPGAGALMSGSDGEDLVLRVPEGTLVRNLEGQILVDMTHVKEFLMLKGGRGGKGNEFFKTSVNQAPEHSQPGERGEELEITLELKLIADVGIIGFPNAGKSTLISRLSAAKPKIADYPFTTLIPNLGVVRVGEFRSFVMADIPGLIKGAHQGTGLGVQFLRHVERTRAFIHLVDVSGLTGRDPIDDYKDINYELEQYDKQNQSKEGFVPLSGRTQIVVLNKIDTLREEQINILKGRFKKETKAEPLLISAATGKGLPELSIKVGQFVFKEEDI